VVEIFLVAEVYTFSEATVSDFISGVPTRPILADRFAAGATPDSGQNWSCAPHVLTDRVIVGKLGRVGDRPPPTARSGSQQPITLCIAKAYNSRYSTLTTGSKNG
jgi:hypothetical protein